jgi:hypothetical protein
VLTPFEQVVLLAPGPLQQFLRLLPPLPVELPVGTRTSASTSTTAFSGLMIR